MNILPYIDSNFTNSDKLNILLSQINEFSDEYTHDFDDKDYENLEQLLNVITSYLDDEIDTRIFIISFVDMISNLHNSMYYLQQIESKIIINLIDKLENSGILVKEIFETLTVNYINQLLLFTAYLKDLVSCLHSLQDECFEKLQNKWFVNVPNIIANNIIQNIKQLV